MIQNCETKVTPVFFFNSFYTFIDFNNETFTVLGL